MGVDAEMFVRTMHKVTDDEIRRWRYMLGGAVGASHFSWWQHEEYRKEPMLFRLSVYQQDGDDIVPEPGETFLGVGLETRYYGIDYERGDFPTISAVAEWLEANIPGGRVYYGGDSSGICAFPWRNQKDSLWSHWLKHGRRPYVGASSKYMPETTAEPHCELCRVPMIATMWGGRETRGWFCYGCSSRIVKVDDGRKLLLEGPGGHKTEDGKLFDEWGHAVPQPQTKDGAQ